MTIATYSLENYWLFALACACIGVQRGLVDPLPDILRPSRLACRWLISGICVCYLVRSFDIFPGRPGVAIETGAGLLAFCTLGVVVGLLVRHAVRQFRRGVSFIPLV